MDPHILRARANQILQARSHAYESLLKAKGSSDQKYLRTVLRTGTLTDRIAAMSLVVQVTPTLNLTLNPPNKL